MKKRSNTKAINLPAAFSKQTIAAVLLFALIISLVLRFSMAAGGASFSLNPSSGSYNINSNFIVSVYENSGSEEVNTIDAKLNYDASKLQFVSVSASGSQFNTCTETTGGSGNISIVCSKLGGVITGNQLVGKVTFKVIAGSGTAAISFNQSSRIYRSSDAANVWNGNTTGGSYVLKTPSQPQQPQQPQNPTPAPGGSNPSTPSTPSRPRPPSNGGNQPITPSDPSQPTNLDTTSPEPPTPPSGEGLITEEGNDQASYKVRVKIVDKAGNILPNAKVSLGGQTATTDADGYAEFTNIAPGTYEVAVESDKGKVLSSIDVRGDVFAGSSQQYEVTVNGKPTFPYLIILPATALLLGGFALFIAYRSGHLTPLLNRFRGGNFAHASVTGQNVGGHNPTVSNGQTLDEQLKTVKAPTPQPSEVIKPTQPKPPED